MTAIERTMFRRVAGFLVGGAAAAFGGLAEGFMEVGGAAVGDAGVDFADGAAFAHDGAGGPLRVGRQAMPGAEFGGGGLGGGARETFKDR